MNYYNNIIETIGNTPLIKLNKVVVTDALVLAKVETFNPGHSIKDRMALKMIEDAEKEGRLKTATMYRWHGSLFECAFCQSDTSQTGL